MQKQIAPNLHLNLQLLYCKTCFLFTLLPYFVLNFESHLKCTSMSVTDSLSVLFREMIKPIISEAIKQELKEHLPQPKPEHDDERFITRQEAAKLLGVGLATLDKLAKFGALQKYRNGSIVRLKKSDVLDTYKTFEKRKRHQFDNLTSSSKPLKI